MAYTYIMENQQPTNSSDQAQQNVVPEQSQNAAPQQAPSNGQPNFSNPVNPHNPNERLKAVLIGIIIIVLVAIAGIAYLFMHKSPKPSAGQTSATSQSSASTKSTNPSTASSPTDAAKLFIGYAQTGTKAEVDGMLSPAFAAQIKQQTGTASYYDNCASSCTVKQISLSSATITTSAYTSASGVKGETVNFKSPGSKGGYAIVELSMIQVNGAYYVDAESDGGGTN